MAHLHQSGKGYRHQSAPVERHNNLPTGALARLAKVLYWYSQGMPVRPSPPP